MELVAYMSPMRTSGRGLLRTAMAAVFGFMSLLHGPVMTFAKAGPAPVPHVSHHVGHHHEAPTQNSQRAKPDPAPICNAFGCFVALDAVALSAPAAVFSPIGALSPAPTDALRAGHIEPPVPPPRLNV